MSRKCRWERIVSQFVYDHRKIDSHIVKAGKSAEELRRFVCGKPPKKKASEEN